jgi:hypothetical protein
VKLRNTLPPLRSNDLFGDRYTFLSPDGAVGDAGGGAGCGEAGVAGAAGGAGPAGE